MSVQHLPGNHQSSTPVPAERKKPLSGLQEYLVELKNVIVLLREVCEELKGLVVIIILLAVFIFEAWKLFH
jgi:hypothetical protein